MKKEIFTSALSLLYIIASAQTIAVGNQHFLALCNDKTVQAWGTGTDGELGNGTFNDSNVPVTVNSLTDIISVAAGDAHCIALKNNGTVWTWGINTDGQLGDGTHNRSNVPIQVSSLTGIIAISGGVDFSLALKNDGTVWAWGNNAGQLGNGTTISSNIPVQSFITDVIAISGGGFSALALKNDGTVWAWGKNTVGQLGNGTLTDSNVPIQVSSLTGIVAICCSAHSLALKNDGTLWAWGWNNEGQIGDGTTSTTGCFCKSTPVQSILTGITTIATGGSHSLALKNDGTLWAWGDNGYGQFGNGTNTNSNVPVSVNSIAGITGIAAGYYNSLARKNDGTAWVWGGISSNNVPVQVNGLCEVANGINNIKEKDTEINVFPNPSGNAVTIKFSSTEKGKLLLTVKNQLGQTIYSETKKDFSGEYVNTIDLSNKPKGIYFVEMILGSERRSRKIIIE